MSRKSPLILPHPAWNATDRPYDRAARIPDLVARGEAINPKGPAVVYAGGSLSHAELGDQSNRVAALLQACGVGRGDLVGLYAFRSPRAIIGLLGVLKAGAAYVPIDIRWPEERVCELVTRHAIRTVITDRAHLEIVASLETDLSVVDNVLCLDAESNRTWLSEYDADSVRLLWDEVAAAPDLAQAAGFDAFGSDEQSSQSAATAYRAHVDSLARKVCSAGARILEIGSGVGLIAGAITQWAGHYVALDPSPVAIKRLQADVGQERKNAVRTYIGSAHELDVLDGELPFDLALLASVVQFFPSVEYFADVLDDVAARMNRGGAIVIADLIAPAKSSHGGLKISPSSLERIVEDSSRLTSASILGRESTAVEGDLKRRYDVVLTVADPSAVARKRRLYSWENAMAAAPRAHGESFDSGDLAYIIFTSGSTGVPKGVEVQHTSVANLIDWINREFRVCVNDRLLFVTSFTFDLSVYDIFGMLAAGGSIRLVSDDELTDPEHIADLLQDEDITFWDSAPAALSAVMPFLDAREPVGRERLRLVFLSGDWVPLSMHGLLLRNFPRAQLVALGGATECTVWSNAYVVDRIDAEWPSIPYGRPMQNSRYYILDETLTSVPVGVDGDLYIAGDCVARGYAGDPVLTAEKFTRDTVSGRLDDRMYNTGDRARWLPEGILQFRGRLDSQVKIRGYRVELGEVQAALARCVGVRDSVAIAVPGPDETILAAFFVPDTITGADVASVRHQLRQILPSYLIPTQLLKVPVLPVSAVGKVDRKTLEQALARIASEAVDASDAVDGSPLRSADQVKKMVTDRREDPSFMDSLLPELVAGAWERALGARPTSNTVSFFAEGGSSLSAVRFAALLQERANRHISVREIFHLASVKRIVETLEQRAEIAP